MNKKLYPATETIILPALNKRGCDHGVKTVGQGEWFEKTGFVDGYGGG